MNKFKALIVITIVLLISACEGYTISEAAKLAKVTPEQAYKDSKRGGPLKTFLYNRLPYVDEKSLKHYVAFHQRRRRAGEKQ